MCCAFRCEPAGGPARARARRRAELEELTHLTDQQLATLGDLLTATEALGEVLAEVLGEVRQVREAVVQPEDADGRPR
jgi:hypothetical protein